MKFEKTDYEKRLRDYLSSDIDQMYKNMLLNLFPELGESKDERIRKALIEEFKKKLERGFEWKEGIPNNAVLAWIEKQGEHARFIEAIQVGDKVTKNEDGVLVNLSQLKRVAKPSEQKQGEQKTAEWSKEDERMMMFCCDYLDDNQKSWLLSLKGRVQPQPKQEWSEEDERLRSSCINHIEEELERIRNDKYGHSEIISDLKESCRERINWLEALSPQSTWKPTEQQMKVLNEVINFAADHGTMRWNDYIYNVLKGLREQLKKLTE